MPAAMLKASEQCPPFLLASGVSRKWDSIVMESDCEALIQQLHSGSLSKQRRAVAALSALPLTSRNWMAAVGAIPRLAQLLHSASGTASPDQQAIQQLLHHVSNSSAYVEGGGREVAPDGVIPPLVSLLLHQHNAYICHVAAVALLNLAINTSNQQKILEAGAITPLVQLLGSGSDGLHIPAAQLLALLAENSGARARILAAGVIGPLLRLLSSDTVATQLSAVMAFGFFAREDIDMVTASAAVPLLVQLLKSSSADVQGEAALALGYLALKPNIVVKIVAAGAIPHLVGLLRTSASSAKVLQQYVAMTLGQLGDRAQSEVIAAGAIEPLVGLLNADTEAVQLAAVRALVNLSRKNAADQARVAAAGAIAPLVRFLQAAGPEELRVHAIMVIAHLACNDTKPIVRAGAVPLLVGRLTDGSTQTQQLAACALRTIARDFSTHTAAFAAAPLLPLVRLLTSGSEEAQEHALQTLLHLSDSPTLSKQFVAAGALPPLVHLLRSDSSLVQQRAVSILGLLAAKGRSDIIASVKSAGALPLLACLQTSASSEALRNHAEKVLQALTAGTSQLDGLEQISISAAAPLPTGASIYDASAASSSSTAAAASEPEAASPQPQKLPPRPRKSCWSCGATGVPMKKCSVCAVAAYCGADCQKADWKAHKGLCPGLKAGAASVTAGP